MPCGEAPDPAWTSGVAPAAFVTGCICLAVALRTSPRLPTQAAAAAWLATAAAWWIEGETSPVVLWAAITYFLLIPVAPVVLTILVAVVLRPSWSLVTGLAWLGAIVLVPAFVGVVEMSGSDFKC